jgi:hypothetical protein
MMLTPNQILPPLNGENDMDVNLCAGVGHNMPLLPELTAIWMSVAIKILLLRSTISVFQMSKLQ